MEKPALKLKIVNKVIHVLGKMEIALRLYFESICIPGHTNLYLHFAFHAFIAFVFQNI